jgi:Carboxypeptidase regulatory-like domain
MDDKKTVIQRSTQRSSRRSSRRVAILAGMAILIGISRSPGLRADDGQSKPAAATDKAANTSASATPVFELRIVGPEGQPIAGAKVNLATQPPLDKVRLRAGKLLNKPRYGVNLQSDADGRIVVEQPPHLESLNFRVHKPGYSFYSSTYNFHYDAPLTVKLQKAWTIGGVVVDGKGQPVPNARVVLQIRFAGTNQMGYSDRLWTNSRGIWKFESVLESMDVVSAEVSEPKYRTQNTSLTRAKFAIEPGHEPTGTIVLETGVTVTGKVTDEAGKPLAKALVRARVGEDTRTAFSGKNGVYRLEGCTPQVKIVATAKGHAAQLKDLELGTLEAAVDFQLKPGKTLRLRVFDEAGRPVPKATVSLFGELDSFEVDQAPRGTDVDGMWEWHEVPREKMSLGIRRPDGMTLGWRTVTARQAEYVFRLPAELVITGRVVDADTKQPIHNYRFTAGYRTNGQQVVLNETKPPAADGTYEIRQTYLQPAYLVRIDADGYWHSMSREIKSDAGKITVDFELLKAKDFAATVLTPEGLPAAGAKVAILRPDEAVSLNRGELENQRDVHDADRTGRAQIVVKNNNFRLVITHPTGYLDQRGLPSADPRHLKLTPWARVEGTVQVSRRPQSDVEVSLTTPSSASNAPPRNAPPRDQDTQTTDSRGRFAFDRAISGLHWIVVKRVAGKGKSETTFTATVPVDCPAGQTAHADVGGVGRPVIGQLRRPPESQSGDSMGSASIMVMPDIDWFDIATVPTFSAKPDSDGNFSLDEIPPGDYLLHAFVPGTPPLQLQPHHFTVSQINAKLSQRPVDLGVLTLKTPAPFAGPAKARR